MSAREEFLAENHTAHFLTGIFIGENVVRSTARRARGDIPLIVEGEEALFDIRREVRNQLDFHIEAKSVTDSGALESTEIEAIRAGAFTGAMHRIVYVQGALV